MATWSAYDAGATPFAAPRPARVGIAGALQRTGVSTRLVSEDEIAAAHRSAIDARLREAFVRVQRYLEAVAPGRVAMANEALGLYGLRGGELFYGMARTEDAVSDVAHRERRMMRDMASHFRIPEITSVVDGRQALAGTEGAPFLSAADGAILAPARSEYDAAARRPPPPPRVTLSAAPTVVPAAPSPERNDGADAAAEHLLLAHQASELSRQRKPPAPPPPFVTQGEGTRASVLARDHVQYCAAAVAPTGFKREDAICPQCGVETLNPCELKRHIKFKHPPPLPDIPASVGKPYTAVFGLRGRQLPHASAQDAAGGRGVHDSVSFESRPFVH